MIERKIYAKENQKIITLRVSINSEKVYRTIANYDFKSFNNDNFILLINKIINSGNDITLSHLISELLNNDLMVDKFFLQKILSCFYFEEHKAKLDLTKAILNYEYHLSNFKGNEYFIDDDLVFERIKKLPFVKNID